MILKSVHHRRCLDSGLPRSLSKKKDILSQFVNPAFKNDYFRCVIEDISSVWCDSVLNALLDHYNSVIADALERISSSAMPSDILNRSISLILKWARSQLGHKLNDDELDEALNLIREKQLLQDGSLVLSNEESKGDEPQPISNSLETPFSDATNNRDADLTADADPPADPSSVSTQNTKESSLEQVRPKRPDVTTQRPESPSPVVATEPPTAIDSFEEQEVPPMHTEDARLPPSTSDVGEDGPPTSAPPQALTGSSQVSVSSFRQTQLMDLQSFSLPDNSFSKLRSSHFDPSKPNLVFGDNNLFGITLDNSSVITDSKYRLSVLKNILKSESGLFREIRNVIICLSSLDSNNKAYTNFSSLRSVIYHSRRVFPEAFIHVILPKFCPDNKNAKELHELVLSKRPGGCTAIHLPDGFPTDNVWNDFLRESFVLFLKKSFSFL